jgi:hypothetical protein
MSKLTELKQHLRQGRVYRRATLAQWSTSVDRHLKQLQEDGTLRKLSGGLYHYPKKTVFGDAPPEEKELIRAFLKDDCFLLTSRNAYNSLGVGTTQLYNETVVYNRKRHGQFELNGRMFNFQIKPYVPEFLSTEFLLVDLVDNLEQLAEDTELVLKRVEEIVFTVSRENLTRIVRNYGNIRTKKFFAQVLDDRTLAHVS